MKPDHELCDIKYHYAKIRKQTLAEAREIVRNVIWKIAQDEGGHILHYNEWVDDNWNKLQKLKEEKR